jgi:hypothetical protein
MSEVTVQWGIAPTTTRLIHPEMPWAWVDVDAIHIVVSPDQSDSRGIGNMTTLGASLLGVRRGPHDAVVKAFVSDCFAPGGNDPARHCVLRRTEDGNHVDTLLLLAVIGRAKPTVDPLRLFAELDLVALVTSTD